MLETAKAWADQLQQHSVEWQIVVFLYDEARAANSENEKRRGYAPTIDDLLHQWKKVVEKRNRIAVQRAERMERDRVAAEWQNRKLGPTPRFDALVEKMREYRGQKASATQ